MVVATDQAVAVADRITTGNLNSALSSAGMTVDEVSDVSTVSGSAPVSAGVVAGMALGGVALLAAAAVLQRRRRSAKVGAGEDLAGMVNDAVAELGDKFRVGGDGKFSPLKFGDSDEGATPLEDFLCVDRAEHLRNMAENEYAIVSEVNPKS